MKRLSGSPNAALAASIFAGAFALVPACMAGSDDTGPLTCGEAADLGRPCAEAGRGGVGGAGGVSGVGGTGGAGQGGGGTGGSGGSDACDADGECTAAGSLCVKAACTEPAASCTKGTLVVVPDGASEGGIAAELAGACHYRALSPALAAAVSNGSATTLVAVYAAAVEGPAVVPAGVRLEGRPTAPAALVDLTAGGTSGAAGSGGTGGSAGGGGGAVAPLVALGNKATLVGFALDAGGAVGVRVAAGEAALEGPLELRGGAPALAVEGTAKATVTGKAEAAVLFTSNVRGAVAVGPAAGLTMTGDKSATGLVVAGTAGGAAILVEAGDSSAEVAITGVQLRANTGSDVVRGEGAVEVRPGRKVALADNLFENNGRGLQLNGGGVSGANDFVNVSLTGNRFVVGASAGVAICGALLNASSTLLFLAAGNELPSGTVDTQAECSALAQQGNCNGGASPAQRDIGVLNIAKPFVVQCPDLPPSLSDDPWPN